MKIKILTIKFDENKNIFEEKEIKKFLDNKKVIDYDINFFKSNNSYFWTILFVYNKNKNRKKVKKNIDIEIEISEKDKKLYERLKEWRLETAREQGIPVYIIFSNNELKRIVNKRPKSKKELKTINGIGDKKTKKYGKEVLKIVKKDSEAS